MGRRRGTTNSDLDTPPEGLKEDYYDTKIQIDALVLKYHIGNQRLKDYVERNQWKTKRRGIGQRNEKIGPSFKHIIKHGTIDQIPTPISSFAEFALEFLGKFPQKWRTRDWTQQNHMADRSQEQTYHVFLPH